MRDELPALIKHTSPALQKTVPILDLVKKTDVSTLHPEAILNALQRESIRLAF